MSTVTYASDLGNFLPASLQVPRGQVEALEKAESENEGRMAVQLAHSVVAVHEAGGMCRQALRSGVAFGVG